jgi:hypothetical protein
VLGVLPVGPSVGAAAAVLILGAEGVAGVSAAGVMLTATGTAGALAYAAWAYADRRWRRPAPTAVASKIDAWMPLATHVTHPAPQPVPASP